MFIVLWHFRIYNESNGFSGASITLPVPLSQVKKDNLITAVKAIIPNNLYFYQILHIK